MITHATISRLYEGPGLTVHTRKIDLEQGQFGAVAPYWCDECDAKAQKRNAKHPEDHETGFIWCSESDIESKTEYGHWTYYGPEEDETTLYCPVCGCADSIGENEADPAPFRATKRYRINHRAIAA